MAAVGRRLQERAQVLPNETVGELWLLGLASLGMDLISIAAGGWIDPLNEV